jgi:predicted metal-dependent hydrolase
MGLDWSCGALAEGLRCYQSEEFFEAHEHWEAAWLLSPEPEKTFLQALIQVTAAFHHLRRRNTVGAASLLTRALRRLEGYPAVYGGIEVQALRDSIGEWLELLRGEKLGTQLPFPLIR